MRSCNRLKTTGLLFFCCCTAVQRNFFKGTTEEGGQVGGCRVNISGSLFRQFIQYSWIRHNFASTLKKSSKKQHVSTAFQSHPARKDCGCYNPQSRSVPLEKPWEVSFTTSSSSLHFFLTQLAGIAPCRRWFSSVPNNISEQKKHFCFHTCLF